MHDQASPWCVIGMESQHVVVGGCHTSGKSDGAGMMSVRPTPAREAALADEARGQPTKAAGRHTTHKAMA